MNLAQAPVRNVGTYGSDAKGSRKNNFPVYEGEIE